LASNFKKLILDIRGTAKSAEENLILDNDGQIRNGVFLECENEMFFYSYNYLNKLEENAINKVTSELFSSYRDKKLALLTLNGRALPYEQMLNYSGISDFTNETKSKVATIFLDENDIFIDKETLSPITPRGEPATIFDDFSIGIEIRKQINHSEKFIKLFISKDTELNALKEIKASFTVNPKDTVVKIGEIVQVSGGTANDFSDIENSIRYNLYYKNESVQFYNVQIILEEELNNKPIGERHPNSGPFSIVQGDWAAATFPLGSHYDGKNVDFAVFSKNAERILLEIYETETSVNSTENARGTDAKYDYWLQKGSDNIWRIKLEDIPEGTYYAFRVWGPNWPFNEEWTRGGSNAGFIADVKDGHRFNPNKVIYDPYARELSHDKENSWLFEQGHNGGMYGTGSDDYKGRPRREFDTGKYVPKGIVLDTRRLGRINSKPNYPQEDLIVMETHVRGFTKHESASNLKTILSSFEGFEGVNDIPAEYRGTYKGAGMMAPYLKGLGFTAIELLPIHESDNDMNPEGEWNASSPQDVPGNFWGYMTYGYFAPDRRYSSDKSPGGPTKEFREMVNEFSKHGIELILDVVYNHTGEGGSWGDKTEEQINTAEITSFKGFDNEQYYMLTGDNDKFYINHAGCGNVMDFRNDVVQQMTLDSLSYWVDDMGASGFRFDLAYVLGRTAGDYSYQGDRSAMLNAIRELGNSKRVKMFAEAWDCSGYGVGTFPSGSGVGDWAEWNDRFRDPLRDLIKGNSGEFDARLGLDAKKGSFTNAFYGSADTFKAGPHKTVNFVVAHDGLTLMDLVSYNMNSAGDRDRINLGLSYPWGPSDGGKGNNRSWDHGGNQELRRQQIRNFWTLIMLSKGVPMTVYGDELNRTQNGNNNPYKLDTIATWNNYNMINTNSPHLESTGTSGEPYHNNYGTDIGTEGQNAFFRFSQFITTLRRDSKGLRTNNHSTDFDISAPKGSNWDANRGHAFRTSINGDGNIDDGIFLVLINTDAWDVAFDIWHPGDGFAWRRIIDTAPWAEKYQNFWPSNSPWLKEANDENSHAWEFAHGWDNFNVPPRSIVVFQKVVDNESTTVLAPSISSKNNKNWGVYTEAQTITISTLSKGADIYYTLDGTDPSDTKNTARKLYTKPFIIDTKGANGDGKGSYAIRAIAICNNIESDISEKRFTITEEVSKKDYGSDVMLQGFHWESHQGGGGGKKWYEVINENGQLIGEKFDWVWLPPPSDSADFAPQGYLPKELNKLDSKYGSEAQLKSAINAIKPAKAIADIVINHRVGSHGWGGFQNPDFGDGPANQNIFRSIANNDEGFSDVRATDMINAPMKNRGWAPTGVNYKAARDIDHTNIYVQRDIVNWMKKLRSDIGFAGFRYDYVKGYAGEYSGYYSSQADAEISIGELWENGAPQDGLNAWVEANKKGGYPSLVFDFSLKDTLNNAFGWYEDSNDNGVKKTTDNKHLWNMAILKRGDANKPAGYIGWKPENAVTFVDNHDTGSTQKHWTLNYDRVYLAYTYILTHPGLPTVAWEHYFDWTNYPAGNFGEYRAKQITSLQEHINTLIEIRKEFGITQTSSANVMLAEVNRYVANIDDKIIVKVGGADYNPGDEWGLIYWGTNFAIWQKGTVKQYQSGSPTLSGTARFGEELTVTEGDLSIKTNLVYTWYRGTSLDVSSAIKIQDGEKYTPLKEDIGKYLIVVATTEDARGDGRVVSELVEKGINDTKPSLELEGDAGETSITLKAVDNVEYRIEGRAWQDSSIFNLLNPDTEYTFYGRFKETDTHKASAESEIKIKTEASPLPQLTGNISLVEKAVYGETLTVDISKLKAEGIEELSNKITYQWLRAGVNIESAINKEYTLTVDDIGKEIKVIVSANGTDIVGTVESEARTIEKAENTDVVTIELKDKTALIVTLKNNENAEFKLGKDGEWQANPIFEGLTPKTEYTFYGRIKETDTHKASEEQEFKVTTNGVLVNFTLTPEDSTLLVKNQDGTVIEPTNDGKYILSMGTYTYTVTKEEYTNIDAGFTVAKVEEENITVNLEKIPANYGLRDDNGVNLPTITYWHTGTNSDITEKGNNKDLGVIDELFIKGVSIKSWKTAGGNVTGAEFRYRVYKANENANDYNRVNVAWTSNDNLENTIQTWAVFEEIAIHEGLEAGQKYILEFEFGITGTGVAGDVVNGAHRFDFEMKPNITYEVNRITEDDSLFAYSYRLNFKNINTIKDAEILKILTIEGYLQQEIEINKQDTIEFPIFLGKNVEKVIAVIYDKNKKELYRKDISLV